MLFLPQLLVDADVDSLAQDGRNVFIAALLLRQVFLSLDLPLHPIWHVLLFGHGETLYQVVTLVFNFQVGVIILDLIILQI